MPLLYRQVIPTQADAFVEDGDDAQGEQVEMLLNIRAPEWWLPLQLNPCTAGWVLKGRGQGSEGVWTPGGWDPRRRGRVGVHAGTGI